MPSLAPRNEGLKPIPARAKRKAKAVKEGYILQKIKDYAYEKYGRIDVEKKAGLFMVKKLSTLNMYGEVGWPDQEWSVRGGITFYIEGKRPGEKPTEIQERRHDELRALGFSVYVIDDISNGKNVIDTFARMAKSRKAV